MGYTASDVMDMHRIFRDKVNEELDGIGKAFGRAPRVKLRAAQKALEHMVETFPDVFFRMEITSLWRSMRWDEKVKWFLVVKLFGNEDSVDEIILNSAQQGLRIPSWLVANPKNEMVIGLTIGIR